MQLYLFTSHIADIDNSFMLAIYFRELFGGKKKKKWCWNYFRDASKITSGIDKEKIVMCEAPDIFDFFFYIT